MRQSARLYVLCRRRRRRRRRRVPSECMLEL